MYVYLSAACLWNRWTDLHKLFVRIPCGRGSVLLWRRCDTLCTSGFVDDVTFSPMATSVGEILGRSLMSVSALLVLSFLLESCSFAVISTSGLLCLLSPVRKFDHVISKYGQIRWFPLFSFANSKYCEISYTKKPLYSMTFVD